MKFVDEYRNKAQVLAIAGEIGRLTDRDITLMEVCGGHTMSLRRFGIPGLMPERLRLVSGPGCPVCVSDQQFLDQMLAAARLKDVIIATYGDLIRVPGSDSSLENEKKNGADVRMVYSVLDAVQIARENPSKRVIFPGIGFETTAPATAAAVTRAKEEGIANFYVLSAHKIMPPVMEALVLDGVKLDGFIAPGHVSAITGSSIYNDLPAKHGLGVVVAGFEPADMVQSILMLVKQITGNRPAVEIQYNRVVTEKGNPIARKIMNEVFELRDDRWRGLGMIPLSGLKLRKEYSGFDAEREFQLKPLPSREPKGCICGDILRGKKTPEQCPLFAKACTPVNPVGACMVSGEGTCSTYYRYRS